MTKKSASPSFDDRTLRASAEEALDAARKAGEDAEALVAAWLSAPNAAAVLEIAERGEGPPRKAARRALNVLRARGVTIPELRRVSTVTSAPAPELLDAWMLSPDSSGMQVFSIAAHAPAGRYRSTFVFLHGAQGVARIDNATMSRSQLDEHFAKILPGSGYGATPVPVPWARARIADARRILKERGIPEPLGFMTAESLLTPVPTEAPPHPFDEEGLELDPADAADLAKGSASLHSLGEFRSWLPTNTAMQELLLALGRTLTPGQEPDPARVNQDLEAELQAATDRFFVPEAREELVRRMKDSAFSVLAREGEQRALEVAAVIQAIASAGLVTNPPRDIPFLRSFFEKAVALMIAQGGGRLRIPVNTPPVTEAAPPG